MTLERKLADALGSDDMTTLPAHARAIVSSARNGVLQRVPDRPHALLIEDREATFHAIEAFLRG